MDASRRPFVPTLSLPVASAAEPDEILAMLRRKAAAVEQARKERKRSKARLARRLREDVKPSALAEWTAGELREWSRRADLPKCLVCLEEEGTKPVFVNGSELIHVDCLLAEWTEEEGEFPASGKEWGRRGGWAAHVAALDVSRARGDVRAPVERESTVRSVRRPESLFDDSESEAEIAPTKTQPMKASLVDEPKGVVEVATPEVAEDPAVKSGGGIVAQDDRPSSGLVGERCSCCQPGGNLSSACLDALPTGGMWQVTGSCRCGCLKHFRRTIMRAHVCGLVCRCEGGTWVHAAKQSCCAAAPTKEEKKGGRIREGPFWLDPQTGEYFATEFGD